MHEVTPSVLVRPDHVRQKFTVCHKAADEVCPVWSGQLQNAHWGIEDPAALEGLDIDKKAAFQNALSKLQNRISLFVNLPFKSLVKLKLQQRLEEIGWIQRDSSFAESK